MIDLESLDVRRNVVLGVFPLSMTTPNGHSEYVAEMSEQQVVEEIAERLCGAYRDVPRDRVVELVDEQRARFDGRPIRDFVPLFVERNAKVELAKLTGD